VTESVLDIFAASGVENPEISVLSEQFLAEVAHMPQKNLALEALRKLLNDEVKLRNTRNAIEARTFSEMLQQTINRYQNRSIGTAQAMRELIRLAKEMKEAEGRGEKIGMTEAELAFYDALLSVDSVAAALDDERVRTVVRDVVAAVQRSATLDWRKSKQRLSALRRNVKHALREHGFRDQATLDNLTHLIFDQAWRIAA
jgi:type I restriction enzyme R subunit